MENNGCWRRDSGSSGEQVIDAGATKASEVKALQAIQPLMAGATADFSVHPVDSTI